MAEAIAGLSLAANIAQFTHLAMKLVDRIQSFNSTTQEMPDVLARIAVQLPLMVEVCNAINARPSDSSSNSINDVVKACIKHTEELQELLKKLLPDENDSRATRTRKAIESIIHDKKLREYQAILETYKTSLALHFGQMTYSSMQAATISTERTKCYFCPSWSGRFVGRKKVLDELDQALLPAATSPDDYRGRQIAVLLGMGGQGKSWIALEFCRRQMTNGNIGFVFWVDATSVATVEKSYANFADHLTKRKRAFENAQACMAFIKETIEGLKYPWLVVFDNFDNVDEFDNIMDFIPDAPGGSVIFTSRHADSARLGDVINISSMEDQDSIELLLNRARLLPTVDNVREAQTIADLLGSLPLAMDQSGAYISDRKIPLSSFTKHFNDRKEKILQHTPALWNYRSNDQDSKMGKSLCAYTTWEMSLDQVHQKSNNAHELDHFLTLLGFMNNLDIHVHFFRIYFQESEHPPAWMDMLSSGGSWDDYEYEDIITMLSKLSLIQQQEASTEECHIVIHPLIQSWIQLRTSASKRLEAMAEVTLMLQKFADYCDTSDEEVSLTIVREGLSHMDACCNAFYRYCTKERLKTLDSAMQKSLLSIGQFYTRHGRYQEAITLFNNTLVFQERQYGKKSSEVIYTKLCLADIAYTQGKYQHVENSLVAMQSATKDAPISSRTHLLKTLGRTYFQQGKYEDAVTLHTQAIDMQKSYLPDDHKDVLETLESLAQVYRTLGNHPKAIDMYNVALEGFESHYSFEHPNILSTLSNIGSCYRSQAEFEKAETFYRRALSGYEKALGQDHPKTINTLVNIAINNRNLERFEEARDLFLEALDRGKTIFEPDHPEILRVNMNLGNTYACLGQLPEATERYLITLERRQRVLGIENPYTMRTVERLVTVLWLQRQQDEADQLAHKYLKAQKRTPWNPTVEAGWTPTSDQDKSPRTANGEGEELETLALLQPTNTPYIASECLFLRARKRDMAVISGAHSDTYETLKSLALVYDAQGRSDEAQRLRSKVEAETGIPVSKMPENDVTSSIRSLSLG